MPLDRNDFILGYYGNDLLKGSYDDDALFGEEGSDWLVGSDGNDYINGGGSSYNSNEYDMLIGGTGADTFVLGNNAPLSSGQSCLS
ncbi:MAG: hypothetical protein KME25_14460 [Symplocastrum torsivum CPER-KK1]|uniref:Uncharacterized protein n=1 Tax=Symplocastrum torsivum CPER-KK1 TaxID=450513 RepID=A0A951PLA3_9CYAN|nr:hypothetical protein [Symplocastrum torsivum CPER-KK1]